MKLVDLSQIGGGSQLLQTVEAISTSYPASKVTTTVASGTGTTYTANELLDLLKTSVDTLTNPSSTSSVDGKIKVAADVLNTSIAAINDKVVSDYVKIYIKDFGSGAPTLCKLDSGIARSVDVTKALTNTTVANAVVDLAASDVQRFTKNIAYALYNLDNTPVIDTTSTQVTLTFANDGTPSLSNNPTKAKNVETLVNVVDEAVTIDADGVTLALKNKDVVDGSYVVKQGTKTVTADNYYERALSGQVVFKTQQTGSFLVSYVYKKRVIEYDEVKSFTSSAITNPDNTFTYAIAGYKLFPIGTFKFSELPDSFLLDNNEFSTVTYANALTDVYNQLFNESSLVDEIIDHLGDKGIQDALKTITDSLTERIAAAEQDIASLLTPVVDTFAPTSRQALFITSKAPITGTCALFINGIHYNQDAYSLTVKSASTAATGANDPFVAILKWTATKASGCFDIDNRHELTLTYITDRKKTPAVVKSLKAGDVANVASTDVAFNTAGVTDFSGVFAGRTAAALPTFDSSAGTKFVGTFKNNINLVTVDQTMVDTSAAVDLTSMFEGCTLLASVDGLVVPATAIVKDMFKSCPALTSVKLKSTGTFTATDLGLPAGCVLELTA